MVVVLSVLGPWGSGKTTSLTMLMELAKHYPQDLNLPKSCKIVSNYMSSFTDIFLYADDEVVSKLLEQFKDQIDYNGSSFKVYNKFTRSSIPSEHILDFLKRPRDPNTHYLVCLDDVYGWLASYFFGNKFNRAVFSLFASGRKKNMNVAVSSIRFKDIDPRIRALHTHLFLPRYNEGSETVSLDIYRVEAFDDRLIKTCFFDARRYFDKYDTYEIIDNIYDLQAQRGPQAQTIMLRRDKDENIGENKITYKSEVQRQKPKGYTALAEGLFWQREIAETLRQKGLKITESYERDEPDIVVWDGDKPIEVVAVKTYGLVVTDRKGMKNMRGQKVAVTFIAQKDAIGEVSYARRLGLNKIRLIAMNLKTKNLLYDGMLKFDERITLREYSKDYN